MGLAAQAMTRTPTHEAITPRLIDMPGACAYLGDVMSPTVQRLVLLGLIPVVRPPSTRHDGQPGRRLLFDVRDLDAVIEAWKTASSAVPV